MTTIADKFHLYCMNNYNPQPYNFIRGQGSILYDESGKDFIDFAGGIAVTALGHNHPQLRKALVTASEKIWHLSNYFTNEAAVDLAESICEHTFADKVFFANSGSEVNEAALKLARKRGRDMFGASKHTIIACNNGFHGRSLFTVSVGGQSKYSQPFAPLPPGIIHIPFNDINALEQAINHDCCAFIVEPVQGEGGVIPASSTYLQAARKLCDQYNVVLILDEVQCGMGRTGMLFDYMHHAIEPDLVTSAKALGCGIPIGAMLMNKEMSTVLSAGTHGSTFGGNPIACAVSKVAFNSIRQPQLLNGVKESGTFMIERLNEMNQRLALFDEIRGRGLLIGCQFRKELQHLGHTIIAAGLEQGVVLLVAAGSSVLRLAPSLIIDENTLQEGLNRVEMALRYLKKVA